MKILQENRIDVRLNGKDLTLIRLVGGEKDKYYLASSADDQSTWLELPLKRVLE